MNTKPIKHLSFALLQEVYAIKITQVKEILAWRPALEIPLCQDWVKGIISIRGKIVPIIDLNARLGLPSSVRSKTTCIVVVELSDKDSLIGFEVDAVLSVLYVEDKHKEGCPIFEDGFEVDFIENIVRIDNETKVVLNIDILFAPEDIIFKELS